MFSKTTKYAIRAVLFLSVNTDEKNKMGTDELSKNLDISRHFLAKILQKLSKYNHVSSAKGRNGGFYLSEKNKESNLAEIIMTFEGKGMFEECILGLDQCSGDRPCPYHYNIKKIKDELMKQFKEETLAESAIRIDNNNFFLNNKTT